MLAIIFFGWWEYMWFLKFHMKVTNAYLVRARCYEQW